MAERRGRGAGSLTYDQEAGRWTGRLDLGRGVAGSRVRVKVVGATRAEARRKLLELRRQHEAGVDVAARGTT
ncbi:MAG: site-specific integrase, partial [Propionibacteriales bacterium]|nr:site-specific integrase [Propionibacteriales bacterium]